MKPNEPEAIPTDRKTRILAAEDDPVTAQLLKSVLKLHGFETDLVSDGAEAVRRWEEGGYDLIIMDVQMPGMDGLAATKAIRQKEKGNGAHIPIIAMTGSGGDDDKVVCYAAGMDACLCKPVDFEEGAALMRKFLQKERGSESSAAKELL